MFFFVFFVFFFLEGLLERSPLLISNNKPFLNEPILKMPKRQKQ